MIRGYLLGFGLLQLAAVMLRYFDLTRMPWPAVLAPLWVGPVLLVAAGAAVGAAWLAAVAIDALERAVPIDDDRRSEDVLAPARTLPVPEPAADQPQGGVSGVDGVVAVELPQQLGRGLAAEPSKAQLPDGPAAGLQQPADLGGNVGGNGVGHAA